MSTAPRTPVKQSVNFYDYTDGEKYEDFVSALDDAKALLLKKGVDATTIRVRGDGDEDGFLSFWLQGLREPTAEETKRWERVQVQAKEQRRKEFEALKKEFSND